MSLLNTDPAPTETAPTETAPIETAPIETAPIETAPVEAPASSFQLPSDWKTHVPEDLRSDPSLEPIKDFEGLIKSYVHSQRMLGSDKVVLPTKYDDGTQLRGVLHKLGLPSDPEKYDVNYETEDENIKNVFGEFKNKAYELGILPNQASEIFKHIHSKFEENEEKSFNNFNAQRIEEQNKLKEEWGQGYASKINLAVNAAKHLAGEDEDLFTYLTSDELGGDPRFVKILAKLGENWKEDNIIADGNNQWGLTPDEADRQIKEIQGNPGHPYNNASHPNHMNAIQEVQKLFKMLG